jgi:hypothetical protein
VLVGGLPRMGSPRACGLVAAGPDLPLGEDLVISFRISATSAAEGVGRDENGQKWSVNTKTITVFIFFIGNKIEIGNSGNRNDIGISETSETIVWCGKYTGNG